MDLHTLSALQKRALHLLYVCGRDLTVSEIATRLNASRQALRNDPLDKLVDMRLLRRRWGRRGYEYGSAELSHILGPEFHTPDAQTLAQALRLDPQTA